MISETMLEQGLTKQIIQLLEDQSEALENPNIKYLDYSKMFDCVTHEGLFAESRAF